MNKYLRKSAVAIATAGSMFATGAMAGPLITNWDFELNSGFVAFAPVPDVTGSLNNVLLGAPTMLSWGDPFPPNTDQSSISVSSGSFGQIEGSLVTNSGVPVPTVTLTHDNNVLFVGPSLTSATLRAVLNLEPTLPPGASFDLPTLDFLINFEETRNLATAADCTATFGVPGETLCEDIFVLNLPAGVVLAPDGSITQSFILDGNIYDVKIFIDGLEFLNNLECATAGAAAGCIGVITDENDFNQVPVFLAINGRSIPEPGILALMGLALAGLAALRRRRT